jgi:L-ascorbate metabolism protein UlaG (beta-lactamase superfamily)
MGYIGCDVALLPISGTYTMNAEEAAQAAARIKPKVVVPMHWGDLIGSQDDVARFRALVPAGIEVVVLEAE